MAMAVAMFGVGCVFLGVSRVFWISAFLMALTGYGLMYQIVASNTIVQTVVDDDKRGRVMSFYTIALLGSAPIGSPAERIAGRTHRGAGDVCRQRSWAARLRPSGSGNSCPRSRQAIRPRYASSNHSTRLIRRARGSGARVTTRPKGALYCAVVLARRLRLERRDLPRWSAAISDRCCCRNLMFWGDCRPGRLSRHRELAGDDARRGHERDLGDDVAMHRVPRPAALSPRPPPGCHCASSPEAHDAPRTGSAGRTEGSRPPGKCRRLPHRAEVMAVRTT